MLGLSSTMSDPPEERGRNLRPSCGRFSTLLSSLSDSDPLALLLHSAVAGVSSSGRAGASSIPLWCILFQGCIVMRFLLVEFLCLLC